jgi:diaminohydroxyphosphoribosylaminopyrimidine deaminase / 5-amino-6-(5-phosphoribosylamino)uracil reductase
MLARALELAAAGTGLVSPGPLVGCVIVSQDGVIAGEGFYLYDRLEHAETIALRHAGQAARGGTAYVSLEPHNHQGRTPPCTRALVESGITRLVCPIEDPNPLVSGSGFSALREAGIEVSVGTLAGEAAQLNEAYFTWHKRSRSFVHLKMAVSLDGRIATRSGDTRWITGEAARRKSHELRRMSDAILVGSNTITTDNPSLTDRSGLPRRRPLVRVIPDNSLSISLNSVIVLTARETPTLVFTNSNDTVKIAMLEREGVEVVRVAEGGRNLQGILLELRKRDLQRILIEGGARVAGAFFDAKLIDKLSFFMAPLVIGGAEAPAAIGGLGAARLSSSMRLRDVTIDRLADDFEISGYPDDGYN